MSTKTEQILEDLKSLTLIEVSDLVEKLEKTFNIDASQVSAGVVMAGVPAAAPARERREGAARQGRPERRGVPQGRVPDDGHAVHLDG